MTALKLKGPPAVWTAFAQQGRWKSWVLAAQLVTNLLFLALLLAVVEKPADIIVVGEDGQGTYVPRTSATAALQDFLRQQHSRAADVTVLAFTQRFVRLTAGINSVMAEEAWSEALGMMMAPLAEKMAAEAQAQKLMETYRLAQVRTSLDFLSVELIERRGEKSHLRARVRRHKEKVMGGGVAEDVLQVDLVLVDCARSRAHPDGLEVLDWRTAPVDEASLNTPTSPTRVTP